MRYFLTGVTGELGEDIGAIKKMVGTFADKFIDYLPTLLSAVIILLIGLLITKLALNIMARALKRSKLDASAHGFLLSIVRVLAYILVIVIVLTKLDVPTTSLVAAIGAAGVTIGLALQGSLSNLAGGFIILFNRPFVSNDVIETNGVVGTVAGISILYTKLLTEDNKVVFIPNGQVSGNKVINYTQEKKRRLDMVFSVSTSHDYNEVIALLKKVVAANPKTLTVPESIVRIEASTAAGTQLAVKAWVQTEDYAVTQYDLLEQVTKAFAENGIQKI